MKSIQRKLLEASELAGSLNIKNRETVSVRVDGHNNTQFHLKPDAFARCFRQMRVGQSKLQSSLDSEGNLHARFDARGAEFSTMVWATDVKKWMGTIESRAVSRIESRDPLCIEGTARPLRLPAPA